MAKKRFILDCDTGQDDAIAIILSLLSKTLKLQGITTVCGSVDVAQTTRNTLQVLELLNQVNIPVYKGEANFSHKPYSGSLPDRHNKHGLGYAELPSPQAKAQDQHAVDYIIDQFMGPNPPDVMVCTAALTNLAKALAKEPKLAAKIPQIVTMAGTRVEAGNMNPVAEFNVFSDPPAVAAVLKSGIPIVMIPLDITHKILATKDVLDKLQSYQNPLADTIHDIVSFAGPLDQERFGARPVHDPAVIAYLINPDLFTGRHVYVDVEMTSPLTIGQTVVDWWMIMGKDPNVWFASEIDVDGFFDLFWQALDAYKA